MKNLLIDRTYIPRRLFGQFETSRYLRWRRPPTAIESGFIQQFHPQQPEFLNVDAA